MQDLLRQQLKKVHFCLYQTRFKKPLNLTDVRLKMKVTPTPAKTVPSPTSAAQQTVNPKDLLKFKNATKPRPDKRIETKFKEDLVVKARRNAVNTRISEELKVNVSIESNVAGVDLIGQGFLDLSALLYEQKIIETECTIQLEEGFLSQPDLNMWVGDDFKDKNVWTKVRVEPNPDEINTFNNTPTT